MKIDREKILGGRNLFHGDRRGDGGCSGGKKINEDSRG